MNLAITIFTLFTGTASLAGFLHIVWGHKESYKRMCKVLFICAGAWSGYLLFIPGSWATKNVAAKFAYFQAPTAQKLSDELLIQRGEVTIFTNEPKAIEFLFPFVASPTVEIINSEGYDERFIPRVKKVTPHQVVVQSSTSGGVKPFRTYRWVARGEPLKAMGAK